MNNIAAAQLNGGLPVSPPEAESSQAVASPFVKLASMVQLPSMELCMELLGLYFSFIHDQFHSLFHRPSLEEDLRNGKVPPVILFAIMALSARFV
jgi:hypothetical protein